MLFGSICFFGIYFVNKGTNSVSFEMVRTKKIYCQNVFVQSSFTEFITLLRLYNYVDMMQSMNGIVCWYNLLCLENNMTKKISNLMILDNSGIEYSRMLLFVFVFLFTGKLNQILAPPATPGLWHGYKAVTSKLSKKQNVTSNKIIFKVLLQ